MVFASGQTERTFTFSATDDTEDDDGESVTLGFGTLPAGVTAGSPNEATVSISDDDVPVRVTAGGYGELSVAWTGGVDITAYDVRHILSAASDKADANWTVVDNAWETDPGGDLAYTIAGLTPGAGYDVQVRAVAGEDVGAWSVSGVGAAGTFSLVAHDWGLRPGTIAVGESFRLLFVTSQLRWGAWSDLARYDSFVRNRAAAGHSDIRAYSAQFKVLASSATIAARDNTRTNPNTHGAGEPVYWLNGPRVAEDYADFYDGWDNSNPTRTETGASLTFGPPTFADPNQVVWTGSLPSGNSDPSHPLGSSNPGVGAPFDGDKALDSGITAGNRASLRLYGLSGVFRVTAPEVPYAVRSAISGSPPNGAEYFAGQVVTATVTFSEEVAVSGMPQLPLRIGDTLRDADFAGGSGTDTLLFSYTVQSDDADDDGISIDGFALKLNGGTITRQGDVGVNAVLTHAGLDR